MRKKGEGKLEDQAWTFGELCTMIRRQRYLWINLGETPGSRDKKPGGGSEQEVWQLAKVIAVKRSIAGYLSVTVRYHAIDFSGYLPNLFCDWLCAHERTFILPSYLGTMLAPFRSVTREDRERALKKSRKLISLLLRPRWMGIRGTSYHLDGIRPPAVRVGNQVQGLAQVSRTIACLEPLRAARRSTLSTLLPYLPMEIWGRERVYMDVAEVYYPPEMDEEQARGLILRLYQASPPSLSELEQGILERCDQFVEVTRPEGSVIEAKIENSASNNPQVPEAGEEAPDEPEEEGSAGQEEGEQAAYLKLLKSEDLGRYLALVQMMALRLALEISLGRDTWGDNIRLPEVPARFGCLQGLLLSSILDRPLFYISDQEGWERLQGQSYPSLSILLVSPRLEGSLPAEAMTHGKRAIFIDLRPEEEEEESSEEGDRAKGSGTGKPPLGIDLDLGSTLPRLIDHFFFTLGERGQSLDLNLDPHQDDLLQTLC